MDSTLMLARSGRVRVRQSALLGALWLAAIGLSLPPARSLIEQSMVWHMVVQMPLLILAGATSCGAAQRRWPHALMGIRRLYTNRLNQFGLSSFMAALVILTYWMLPVAIDRAVTLSSVDAAKVGSLWLCGACLKSSVLVAPRTVQVFFIGYVLAMLITLGVYFVTSDVRLCNAYSAESQMHTGYGLIAIACIVIGIYIAHFLRRSSVPLSSLGDS